ncbi:50S ribosomal protein L24 [Candidatus Omnitrophota bacterium]
MNKIKKNDTVFVLAGKDKGKTGRVLRVFPGEGRALVEGVNYVKRHMRKQSQDQQGGIVQKESPIDMSSIAIYCKTCKKKTKVGLTVLADSSKLRFCKRCKENF